ncbi:hypothetical protein WN71_014705 [Streptomyces mangrovisoli]|uniref:Secreted protein n=1 Tax=Streptomyces mangrovisoli TaxID=1428628 RepID=A0A1J4P1C0_9ACTN|nr:hypothetical protein WN71_014705 [Streptomyces mangrovisoli]
MIVCVVAVLAVAAALTLRARRHPGGPSLKRRFGPEYDRTVAQHDGDTAAAERELAARVERHGDLRSRPLDPERREGYEARWAAAQETFVDSPRDAVTEADRLLSELARDRGFPDGGQYEEQLAALSVHHAHHVQGYRQVHGVARTGEGGTEELRTSMVEARGLFEDLIGDGRTPADTKAAERADAKADTRADTTGDTKADTQADTTADTKAGSTSDHGWIIGGHRHKEGRTT